MRLAAGALVAAMTMGASAWAQTTEADGEAPAEGMAEDGTPLLLPGQEEGTIETDATATEEGLQMDGTIPVDSSPGAASQDDATATAGTEGGAPGAAAVGEGSAAISTDVTAEGDALLMDGTVPVDETPEPEGD